ncbi:MAG: PAS domain S-box protein [Acidobacteria bacterium]|nr:PAS domain S-box protein [Acidobacteriota bacterium]MBV9147062.1 PAS domain S-box protein [Acidobacteriota bacterium]MBV9436378.1 PAS domain S-box protein [Acidobacteriota bacterium]
MFKAEELILAQQAAGLAIWEWTVNTGALDFLPGSAPLFGLPPEQLRTAEQLLLTVMQQDREAVQRTIETAIASGKLETEFRVLFPSGSVRWIRSQGQVVHDLESGKILLGVSQDITDLKQRERTLVAQVRLLELAHEPIMVRDAQNRIIYWNSGAQGLYGYSPEEAKGQVSHELLRTKFPLPLPQIERQLMGTGTWEGELAHTTRAGRVVHVASRWRKFSSGEAFAVLETNFDLSQERALQVAKLWEQKAKLLGELSHEINNPLAAAASATYMLKNGVEGSAQQYIAILESSISRIAEFIRKSDALHQSARDREAELRHNP